MEVHISKYLPQRLVISDRAIRFVGLYSIFAAAISIVIAPLFALSYFATSSGAEQLDTATVNGWAEPAREIVGGLLTFASAERVYATYLQLFALLFPAIILCAWVVRTQRHQLQTNFERWGWRITLLGYSLIGLGLAAVGIVLIAAAPTSPIPNNLFLSLIIPGLYLGTVGSTLPGIRLLRSGYYPRLTAWLLAFAFPLWIMGGDVLGHNSLGIIPLFVAWAITGWRLWRRVISEPARDTVSA
jgi:hypothetical protein